MKPAHHYLATATRTMCGLDRGPRIHGTGDGEEFASALADPQTNTCPKCTAVMRRFALHRAPLRRAMIERLQRLGVDVTHG